MEMVEFNWLVDCKGKIWKPMVEKKFPNFKDLKVDSDLLDHAEDDGIVKKRNMPEMIL